MKSLIEIMNSEKLITKKLLFCEVFKNSQHSTLSVFLENFLRYSEQLFLKKFGNCFLTHSVRNLKKKQNGDLDGG